MRNGHIHIHNLKIVQHNIFQQQDNKDITRIVNSGPKNNNHQKKKKELYLNKVILMQNNFKRVSEKCFRCTTFTFRNVVIMHY